MQRTENLALRSLTLTILIAVLTILLLTAATGVGAAPAASQINVGDQNLNSGIAVVDTVTAAESGWVVIYKGPDFTTENLVGYAPVHAGTNRAVKVVVSLPKIGNQSTLWAVLQSDNGTPGVFEWGLKQRVYADSPRSENGKMVMTSFQTAAPAAQQTGSSTARRTQPTSQITIRNQSVRSGIILVDAVTTNEPGWLVFYKNPDFTVGEIVGFAPVYSGTNRNVRATIDTAKLGKSTTVWAQLHRDEGRRGVFEWQRQGESPKDWPLVLDQKYVRASFSTAVTSAPTTTVDLKGAHITVRDQDLNTGIIMLDAVTTTQNGWVVIYKNPNFTSGEIVGFAPVYQGLNEGVRVTIDTEKVGDAPRLWAVLHAEGGLQNIFEWGYRGRQHSDQPLFQKGQYISTSFRTMGQPAAADTAKK